MGALVLANLGQNAIEASPAGAAVRIETERSNDGVVFSVTDEGPGFPAEAAADPFQPRRSAKPGGAGIGLAISRQLALHAGGELTLARSDARGSVLRLRLPAAGSPARGGAP
jgi:signal transduction histidine kinase